MRRSFVLSLVLLVAPGAPAATDPPAPDKPDSVQPQVEAIRKYLEADLFVKEGVGLKRVHLGQSFRQVLQTWGTPTATRAGGLFGNTRQWLYRVGDTQILVSGETVVETIAVRGGVNSEYQTAAGARFGMAPYQVTSIYGAAPETQGANTLSYPQRGVRFEFERGRLLSFEVFAPQRN